MQQVDAVQATTAIAPKLAQLNAVISGATGGKRLIK